MRKIAQVTQQLPPLSTSLRAARYEDEIPLRGCKISLSDVAKLFENLEAINLKEGEARVAGLVRQKGTKVKDFEAYKNRVKKDAFRVTVSIIGFDGQTRLGDSKDLFASNDLPLPIKIIFLTNTTAFKAETNGQLPPNGFECFLHFDKPPLFDHSPLVSEPTPNPSKIIISAGDGVYFKAAQQVAIDFAGKNHLWYRFVHKQFAYDIVLWFLWVPFSLFKITSWLDGLPYLNSGTTLARITIGFYLFCLSLIFFRGLMGYIKWAFPVNVLTENKDSAAIHRIVLGTIVLGILYNIPINWISKSLGIQ